jgi:hypothetical protein
MQRRVLLAFAAFALFAISANAASQMMQGEYAQKAWPGCCWGARSPRRPATAQWCHAPLLRSSGKCGDKATLKHQQQQQERVCNSDVAGEDLAAAGALPALILP